MFTRSQKRTTSIFVLCSMLFSAGLSLAQQHQPVSFYNKLGQMVLAGEEQLQAQQNAGPEIQLGAQREEEKVEEVDLTIQTLPEFEQLQR